MVNGWESNNRAPSGEREVKRGKRLDFAGRVGHVYQAKGRFATILAQ